MPPRKSAADVILAAGVPDQPRNGLGQIPRHFRAHKKVAGSVFATVELTRKELRWIDELGADVPIMQIASIQIPEDQELVGKVHRETEEAATGQYQVANPPADAADAQAARRAELQQAVMDWCNQQGEISRDLWERYFGGEGAPAGPLGAELVHLIEFADHHLITPDEDPEEDPGSAEDAEEASADGEDTATAEDDARHAVARTPAFTPPAAEWSDG